MGKEPGLEFLQVPPHHIWANTSSPWATAAYGRHLNFNSKKHVLSIITVVVIIIIIIIISRPFCITKMGNVVQSHVVPPRGSPVWCREADKPLAQEQTSLPCQPSGVALPSVVLPAQQPIAASLVLSKSRSASERAFVSLPSLCHAPF